MKRVYLILSFLFLCLSGYAQTAASYGFTALSGPFASIAATGTPIPTLSDDDFTEPGIPIGFSFNYCGVSYTDLSACSNGWISLTNSSSIEWDNFEAFIDGPGWLMPFWDDNTGLFLGNAYYTTTGVAPNRIFTLEWNSFESISGLGDITFQIKLYETTNVIDFHYGTSSLIFTDATIGISNDNVSDWQTLSDESAAPTPLLAPTFETFIFGAPADGQIYRWTPTCSLPAPIAGTLTICPGLTTTLTHDTLGGTWSSSDVTVATIGSASGILTGLTPGTSSIVYTAASGCVATAIVTVTAPSPITGTLTVCEGLSSLLGNATAGGTWSSGDPGVADVIATTGLVNGFTLGTATISYTLPDGCVATAVVTVAPAAGGISGTLELCPGGTTTLTDAVLGGTWSSSFTSIATVDPITGLVTAIAGGVTTISYIMPSGCFRITAFTVNPLPAPITGGTAICISGTLPLDCTTFGGTWTSSTPAVGTVDPSTGLVTGIAAGTTTITYTLASGCYRTSVVSVTAVVAVITGTTVVCKSASTTLSCSTAGGSWASSTPAVGTIDPATGAFLGIDAGTATVSYLLGSGCFTTTTVTVDPLEPITGTASICRGASSLMANAVPGGTWTSGAPGTFSVDPVTGLVSGVSPGSGLLTYVNPFGCSTSITVTINLLPSVFTGNLYICVGNTTLLSSTPLGGTWTDDASGAVSMGAPGDFTGATPGTSTVTYSLATGCIRTAVVSVDPAPTAISGVTVLCPNTTALLSHATVGGTWSSSNTAIVTVGTSSGIATGVSLGGGTATITYTLPASGCIATTVVTVLPAPAAVTGSLSVCVGANTTLSTASLGATWSSSNTAVATIGAATGIVSGLTPGTSTIVCYGTNGCTRSVVVTVNANPAAITGTATVCVGATTTLSTASGGGAWSSSSNPVGTVSAGGGVVGGISANTVNISYTLPTGCYAIRVVTVNALPTSFTPTTNALCVGTTVTFTSTPAAGTWSSSNTTNAPVVATTGVVSGNAAGTAIITYTHPTNGCLRTRTVTVNALPAAIGGPGIVCPGTTVTLTNTSTPGTWSSSAPVVGTINTGTGVLMGLSGGTTQITYTLSTGCIRTTDVTVIAAPVAAITPIGDTVLCPGDFVTLTCGAAPGATYTWFVGGVPIPSATGPTYIASTSGSYQVRVSVSAGCSTLSVPMSVSVVPATATITLPGGSTSTCAGTPVALDANTGVGLTYQWELAGSAIAGATASTYSALIGGNYTVRVTNAAGCWAVSAPVSITVLPAPANIVTASGPLTFCNGGNVVLSAAAGTAYTYQWYNLAGLIPGATSMSYAATTSGSYHAVITNATGCVTTTAISVVVVNPLPNVAIAPGGPTVFCTGGIVSLTAASGFTYQWYRDGVAIAGANSVAYIASIGGGYRVRVTNAATGCTDMTHADTVVSVIASPSVIPLTPAKFCWGGSSLLTTSVSGLGSAIMYQWSFNGVVIPGATNGSYNASAAGNYDCTISVPSSCTVVTGPIAVSQVALPDPPITYTGTSLKTGNYYLTYQWYKNLVMIPGATSFSTPSTGNGSYKVQVTDTNGCQNMSAAYVLTGVPGTGITDINSTEIRIFPNPAQATVHIESVVTVRAAVSGVDGRMLLDISDAKDIDISKLADGIYVINLFDTDNNLLKTQKLVKRSE
jgi:uncharacterized protein YjdB